MLFLRLYLEFVKVGLFSVGGGLATIPFLYELSDNTGWFSRADIADMIAISESTPGPIGVNMATYAGYTTVNAQYGPVVGILGSIISTLGLITPAIFIIFVVAKVLAKFKDNKYVASAFYGLRPASIALISAAGIGVAKIALINIDRFANSGNVAELFSVKALLLFVGIFVVQRCFKKIHPVVFILASAVIGAVFSFAS